MSTFPSTFPACCPPADATDAKGVVHRICMSNPATTRDFLTHEEKDLAPDADPCDRASISVFQTHERACHRMRLSPWLGTVVVSGELKPEHGKMKLTNQRSGHINWWPYENVARETPFTEYRTCP